MCDSQTKTEPKPIAEIVREKTNDGQLIVDFLIDMVQGKMEGATYWHRLEATRQLEKLGLELPQAVKRAISPPANGPKPSRATGNSRQNDELADIIKEETDGGRDIVRFLVDVMQGNLDGFKPRHRLAASNELLKRGFDIVPDHTGGDDDEHDDPESLEQLDNRTRRNAKRYNDDEDPFDFDHYDLEDYKRDRMGHRAEVHIFGSEEAREVALNTVREYWRELRAGAHISDFDYSPIKNPEDDPYGKGCYGYKVLRIAFQDNGAIRAANKAVAEYLKRKIKHLINENGSLSTLEDTASLDPQTLQYLERSRHLLTDNIDRPPEDPETPSSVTPERPQKTPVGAGFKPEHPQNPPVGVGFKPTRDSEGPPAPTPPPRNRPRRRPPKIYLGPPDDGPPDENPRERRVPGHFRTPVGSIWATVPP